MHTRLAVLAVLLLGAGMAMAEPTGPGPRGPDIERLALLLDLDESQKVEVKRILDAQHEQMRAAFDEAKASGERPSREQMRSQREELRASTRAQLQGVLNETQLKKFEALMERNGPPPRD